MKKHYASLLIKLCIFTTAWSQSPQSSPILIQGETGKLFVGHVVEAGENLFSIGRMYNMSPKEIALFNGESPDKPLEIGQDLKIPLTVINFSQDGSKAIGESLVPIYHIIQEREWFYRISTNYNRVPIENLEKWNHITKEQGKKGMQLIVGFLKVKTAQSALAKDGVSTDKLLASTPDKGKKEEVLPPTGNLAKTESKPLNTDSKPVNNTLTLTESKPVNSYSGSHPMGGYFRTDYSAGNGSINGEAGIFKSTSGWQDGKYYALMNKMQVGTIIKVSNPMTRKIIYAKVLGQLPDMKESAGLIIRISNAAASELGTDEQRFLVEIKY